ncbi:ubiquitin-like domain-containing protein [Streptomyces sp. NPDC057287]|uniref:ubiquitin-like domain-containing protein n=1 Tax=Streptomyces sp. NPDC057287 TaxID=3346086 RepID=UPI003639BD05
MGHSQGSHRAPRGGGRAGRVPARVPAPAPPRPLHEERTIVAGLWSGPLPVHDPTVLDTPLAPRPPVPPARPAGSAPPARPSGHRAVRRHRSAPEGLRRLVPRALVLAVLAGGTAAFLTQDKAVQVSVDGTSRTLHTFADDVGELLDAEGVTVGARDTVAPAPATVLDDGDEVVVRRETRGSRPVPGAGPRGPRRP